MITLKTLAQATEQEIFNQVVEVALEQQKKQLNSRSTAIPLCSYRSSGGFKCFAGMLIGDDEYKPEFEGKTWVALVEEKSAPQEHAMLIDRLQKLHDRSEIEGWVGLFKDFARDNGLIYNGEKKE